MNYVATDRADALKILIENGFAALEAEDIMGDRTKQGAAKDLYDGYGVLVWDGENEDFIGIVPMEERRPEPKPEPPKKIVAKNLPSF